MYDPLRDKTPPNDQIKPSSFWAANPEYQEQALVYPALTTNEKSEIVIIGAGYTGLSCAIELSQTYNVQCTVVEANQPAWGCSGRNGGFVLPGTGRLSVQQIAKRWGKAISQAVYKEYLASIDAVKSHISDSIECEAVKGGYLKLAHKPALLQALHAQAQLLSSDYGDSIQALSAEQIESDYLSGTHSYGGIYYPQAFAINPWLFGQGLAKKAEQLGVKIYGGSAVQSIQKKGNTHKVSTHWGSISATTLILASNGYGQRHLHNSLKDRSFPVISSIIVTEVLNEQQLQVLGMRAGLMTMDTRALKYYYRLLPDNRLLFGGRGAVYGKDADKNKYLQALHKGLNETFPSLTDVSISHFWSGWVSVSLDDFPRIYHDKSENVLYSAGYCGAGLAFSVQAGKRMAQLLMAPQSLPDLPYWQSPLPVFPLQLLRRPALRAFYAWESLKRRFTF